MSTIYIYVLDTLADWELGYVLAELNSRRFFKKNAPKLTIKMVSHSSDPIKTMGGLTIIPDCLIEEVIVTEAAVLLLPGADTWHEPQHNAAIQKAKDFLSSGATVGAICGATSALASLGLLDHSYHTSNGPGFLEMFNTTYNGTALYVDVPSVVDKNLITAGSTGGLLWTKQIIEQLGVFEADTLEFWYQYFSTGDPQYFFSLMESLPVQDKP